MIKRERYKKLILFLMSAVIIALQTGVFAYVWLHCYKNDGAQQFARGNYVLIALYGLMICLFDRLYGGFKVGYLRIIEVLSSQILSTLCVNTFTYLQLSLIGRWSFGTNLSPILAMTVVDILLTTLWVVSARWVFIKIYPPRKLIVVYGNYSPDHLVHKLKSRADKYDIKEIISCDQDIDIIKEKILNYDGVVLTDIPSQIRNKLLKFAFEYNIRCYCVPKISDILITNSSEIHLFDTSMLLMRNAGMSWEAAFVKRAFDITASLVAIVVTLPIMLLIAVFIKLYDGGPVLFTQDRLTKDKKVFKIYKFRSMRVQQENQQYCMTRKKDERITPVGKVIRAIHFDELPQLFNILKGDMSFVGPRPECPKLAEEYRKSIPEFDYRLKVRAGLTGFAQVYGKYNTKPYDKLKLDLKYIQHFSLLLDLKLLLLTFKVLFQKENTEGIESWQTSADSDSKLVGKK